MPPFQTLLDDHGADVMAVLRGAVGRSDADDCFQETFLAALRAYPRLENAKNLRGWLLTIAHRKAIDHHRATGRSALPVGTGDELEAHATDGGLAPEGIADGWPFEEGIWARVATLPPKQRAAVALRYGCDLPHAEIAAALGCSQDAARRSLHEGVKRLRIELGHEDSRSRKDRS